MAGKGLKGIWGTLFHLKGHRDVPVLSNRGVAVPLFAPQ